MAKFYGAVGYGELKEIRPGVWEDIIIERKYYGDIQKDTAKWREGSDKVHSELSVANTISVMADAYANDNFHAIRYIHWAGSNWSVSEVQVERPRLIFRLGGVYNGPVAEAS